MDFSPGSQGPVDEDLSYEEYKAKRDAMMSGRNYVKWILPPAVLGFLALMAYGAYYALFYFEEPGNIQVEPAALYYPVFKWDKAEIYTALDMIETTSPEDFSMIEANVKKILVYPSYGYKYGRFDPDDYRGNAIYIMNAFPCPTDCDGPFTGEDLIRAAVIIHEACHAMQYNTGQGISEGQCRQMGYDFIASTGPILLPGYNESKYDFLGREGPYTELVQGELVSEMLK